MGVSPIDPYSSQGAESSKAVSQDPQAKKDNKVEAISICAVILAETAQTKAANLNQDEKAASVQNGEMRNLLNRMRSMGHWKWVFATHFEWKTYVHHDTPSLWHHWNYTSTHIHTGTLHKATGAQCMQEQKGRMAEQDQLSQSFGATQTRLQAPETSMTLNVNGVEQAQQQGIDLLCKLLELTQKAMAART